MNKYYCCRVGELESVRVDGSRQESHFYKSFHKPIIEHRYTDIRWAVNEASIHKNKIKSINIDINNGINIFVILIPSSPNNFPYAICELKQIKERILGPLLELDETNSERGWINGTSSGHDDFKYDFIFKKIYLLNRDSFDGIKIKGQNVFFELKQGQSNEEYLNRVNQEIRYILRYIQPIIL